MISMKIIPKGLQARPLTRKAETLINRKPLGLSLFADVEGRTQQGLGFWV